MWTESKLNDLLTTPSTALVEDMKRIDGDIMILGAGGKMGPTLCVLAKKAAVAAGTDKRIIAVSRFSDSIATQLLQDNGVETISCDLQDVESLYKLPDVKNVIFMAGRKFGTNGSEWQTWGMNAVLPAFVGNKFRGTNMVVFSSGNIYPQVPPHTGGCNERTNPSPIGEYAMSCLARERAFEYAANTYGTKTFIYRLNYAVDLRYGVLFDIADNVLHRRPISLTIPCFNIIWQGTANEIALRGLLYGDSPVRVMNITGPEIVSVRKAANRFGELFGVEPIFAGEEGDRALLNDASDMVSTFGYPTISAGTLIDWQAEWLLSGGRSLGKPTHFEESKGVF